MSNSTNEIYKTTISNNSTPKKYDIYSVNLDSQIGSEQSGNRPAIIVQNDIGNFNSPTTIICPITTQKKLYSTTHVNISKKNSNIKYKSIILCEQVRVIDKSRLGKKFGCLYNESKREELNKKLKLTLEL